MYTIYDCATHSFSCSTALRESFGCPAGGFEVLLDGDEHVRLDAILSEIAGQTEPSFQSAQFFLKNSAGHAVPCRVDFVCDQPGRQIMLTIETEEPDGLWNGRRPAALLFWDEFLTRLDKLLADSPPDGAVVYFDIQRFKVINSMFGMLEGDRLLRYIAEHVLQLAGPAGFACRTNADRFVFYTECSREQLEERIETLFDDIASFGLPFEILCNAGIYRPEGASVAANTAVDYAILAQNMVKGSFTSRFRYYSQTLSEKLLSEQEIAGAMRQALAGGQFLVYYQPQYNHTTQHLVGAEALVRWLHPEKGLIPPGQFIPVFEKNGFISRLDAYIFDRVCAFQKARMDRGVAIVPVSVNLTRYDLFNIGFLEQLEETRQRYAVPAKYVRVEITESSALGGSRFINEALAKLHSYGYTVEMDDFGSGYSSLNILKDIDFDIIKLDMSFIKEEKGGGSTGRGGTILSSVVRMINWLQLPMIAEGVETPEQADFLRSIGCECIQGYLYSRPLPEREFDTLLLGSHIGEAAPNLQLIETMHANRFWSNDSLETLIFSNYVGGAAIFDYQKGGRAEILRTNRKYVQELGMNLNEKDLINHDVLEFLDDVGRIIYLDMLDKAIESGDEQECETWRTITSPCCGEDKICVRSTVRVLGRSKDSYIFYSMIRNITSEKQRWVDILDNERRFKVASEQVNIYYWEYNVATREMRPCYRCMRDLGLPALLQNYPDSAIAMGVFPPEIADEYREWHRKIARGVPHIEGILPLTVGRVPFHVRYTTEFDESGRPVKAYGSAALVVDR